MGKASRSQPIEDRAPDFERLFEAMPHPYLILNTDAAFTIAAVNEQYLAVTGTHRAEIVGRGLFDAFPNNPDDTFGSAVSDLRTSLQRVLRDRVRDVMGVQKYDIPQRDGTKGFKLRYWSPVNTPVVEADGSVSFIIHHVEDVTEFVFARERGQHESARGHGKVEGDAERSEAEVLRRASELKEANRQIKAREAELAVLNARLQNLNRMKSEFFSGVSHEFRSPLTLILGPLEELLADSGAALPARSRDTVAMVHRNALRLLKLVNSLLEFTRLESKRVAPHRQPTDLSQLTVALVSNFEPLCEHAGIGMRVDCPALAAPVLIDREMWERIVLNLVSNAFKFTFKGAIEVSLSHAHGGIELCVADTGVGIPAGELTRIFERFHRVEATRGRSYEGSGIGLALVKELCELLGGTISVESVEGQGTRFTVRIPVDLAVASGGHHEVGPAHATVAEQASPLARAVVEEARQWLPNLEERVAADLPGPAAGGSERILVVDDNADMRSYIRGLLADAGFVVQTAPDGAAAWAACESELPDLVLADVMLPVSNGLELLERLRADGRTAQLPVILLSARAAEETRSQGMWNGADDCIGKPFYARELIARVRAVLHRAAERRRTEAELRQAAAVFTASNDAVIITDSNRRIVAVNGAFTKITGFSQHEVIGRSPNLQKSGRHEPEFYRALWESLRQTGQWQGEIWNRRKNGELYPAWESISAVKNDHGAVVNYVAVFSDIGSIKATQDQLAYLAHHDALTGLPNRLLFNARLDQSLEHARRSDKRVALLLLDLDRFKLINDTMGHAAGDRLLEVVAKRLKEAVRAEDTVARLGGDEFAIVLHETTQPQDALLVAEKVRHLISAPIVVDHHEVKSAASIGISLYPDDAQRSEDLVKAADVAMYRAKRVARQGIEFYTAELTAEAEEHLSLELALPLAMATGELSLEYQPQVDLATGRIMGAEALLRWMHPKRGNVSPLKIIKVAEESGFIDPLGRWILETATRQAAAWNVQGFPDMHIAVNLSGRQLTQPHLVRSLADTMKHAQLGGWRVFLDLEITETIVSADGGAEVLRQLRSLGVGIAIDDFGTGYSSLSRLKSLPIDVLKIDQSFVRNIPQDASDCAITAAIVALGHQLGLKVVAEGVERREQIDFLRAHHCDAAQGYLLCRPTSADALTQLLKDRSGRSWIGMEAGEGSRQG